jgi:hypothetical protein
VIATLLEENHKGFLPASLRNGTFLKWLKRTHAWLGLWGAALGLLFGVSGFLLNHRAQLKINAVTPVENTVQVALPDEARIDPRAFSHWFAGYAGMNEHPRMRTQPSKTVIWNDRPVQKPAEWSVTFSKPEFDVSATYTQGNSLVEVKRTERNFWGVITRLHKGDGASIGWVLLIDTLAGALVMLCITGFLLWSRLHGPRLVALGLMASVIVLGCYTTLG